MRIVHRPVNTRTPLLLPHVRKIKAATVIENDIVGCAQFHIFAMGIQCFGMPCINVYALDVPAVVGF